MRLASSLGIRFLVFLPLGLVFTVGMGGRTPRSVPPAENARGGPRLWIDGRGVQLVVGRSRRSFRLPAGRGPSDPAVIAYLRRSLADAAASDTRRSVSPAMDGFLVSVARLGNFESRSILTRVPSIDLDADGRGEVLVQQFDRYIGQPSEVWEHDEGPAPFVLAHAYTWDSFPGSPEAFGDLDRDGSPEIASGDFDYEPWRAVVHLLQQSGPGSYDLTETVRFVGHDTRIASPPVNVALGDLDGDHLGEVIYAETEPGHLSVNEADGSGGFREVFLRRFDRLLLQRMIITGDLDDDGRSEILVGGLPDFNRPSRFTGLLLYEADADNRYRLIWNAGPTDRNMVGLADAGDTDGDGRREFLVGSLSSDLFNPRGSCTLYEYDGAEGFLATWEASDFSSILDYVSVAAYDLDGDGRRELLCSHRRGPAIVLDIYKNTGDDAYELLFSSAGETGEGLGMGRPFGFGDFDEDQHPELVLNETTGGVRVTKVYETTQSFPAPPPTANLGAQPLLGAAPLSVRLTDLSEGIVDTRLWDFGDGATSTEAAPTHVYERPGTYAVSLAVTGPGGSDTKVRPSYVEVVPCPTKAILSGGAVDQAEPKLRAVRDFRDGVLARSQAGRALIEAYYRNGVEVDRLLRSRAALKWKTARLLLRALPLLDRASGGAGVVTVDGATWEDLSELIAEYEAPGSPELKRDLAELRIFLDRRATRRPEGSVILDLSD
jgi:PKD domain/FG-GAP-like repeat